MATILHHARCRELNLALLLLDDVQPEMQLHRGIGIHCCRGDQDVDGWRFEITKKGSVAGHSFLSFEILFHCQIVTL